MRTRFDSSPPYQFLSSLGRGDLSKPFEGRYAEAIAFFDHHLGEFFAWLKGDDLFDPTLVVVSADHGESFSHGYGGHGGPMLHDDLIRIPLLVKEPGQTVGRRVNVLSEQIDLMPTLLDLAGQPAQGATEGRSLVPALRGKPMTGPVFSMNFEQNSRFGPLRTGSVAMLEDRWKYVHYTGPIRYPNMPALTDALYDLQIDPGEIHNLAATEPGVAARMQAAILQQMRMHDRGRP
jgi:arylsulfatase A-like enzyme